jgi:hypothetical protein
MVGAAAFYIGFGREKVERSKVERTAAAKPEDHVEKR